uniref:MHC class I-like antigen recognition-like domain-containing protein n=1 Tax=Labrus bergylta TaxID=56723 RepID=A0A3Q3E9H6_9LABR
LFLSLPLFLSLSLSLSLSFSLSGVHIYQNMYGCEWDDETGDVNGYNQYGYDGEDFIVLDLKTWTWVAAKQQAVVTKQKWDNNKAQLEYLKNYYTKECVDWLKKFVNYGRSSLMRTGFSRLHCKKTVKHRLPVHTERTLINNIHIKNRDKRVHSNDSMQDLHWRSACLLHKGGLYKDSQEGLNSGASPK